MVDVVAIRVIAGDSVVFMRRASNGRQPCPPPGGRRRRRTLAHPGSRFLSSSLAIPELFVDVRGVFVIRR
jgi:hypothetical protein